MTSEALATAATESGPRRPWATAASDTADTTPMELSALGAHVDRCNGSRAGCPPRVRRRRMIASSHRVRDHCRHRRLVFGVASLVV
jgi:hypothetical protein